MALLWLPRDRPWLRPRAGAAPPGSGVTRVVEYRRLPTRGGLRGAPTESDARDGRGDGWSDGWGDGWSDVTADENGG